MKHEDLKPMFRPNAAQWKAHGGTVNTWIDALVQQFVRLSGEDVRSGISVDDAAARSRLALEDVATVATETWDVTCRVVDHGTLGDYAALSIAIQPEGARDAG